MTIAPVVLPATTSEAPLDPTVQRRYVVRAVSAAAIGTTIEWYDFFLYGVAAATVFPRMFFPGSDPLVGTLLSFSTYFVGSPRVRWAPSSSVTSAIASAARPS